jgi:hypothetical protein
VQAGIASNTHTAIKSGLKAGEVIALESPQAPPAAS